MKNSQLSTLTKPDRFVILFMILGIILLVFIILPILTTILGTGFPIFWRTITDPEALASLGLTFYAAFWATILAFTFGVPLAYILARYEFGGKRWMEGLVNLPIVIPHTAAGIALLMVFGRRSWFGALLDSLGIRFVDQLPGIVVGMTFVSLPFLVNAARDAFAMVDPELEKVALSDGATPWQVFTRVTLPLAWRGVMSGAVMMWGRGISEFGAIVILAYHPKVIPVLVYERFSRFGLDAAQPVAVLLILASLAVFFLVQILVRARHS